MKRILLFLICLVSSISLFSQTGYINTTTTGSATTLFKSKGYLAADSAFILLQNFSDTGAANYSGASLYSGSFIRVGSQIWHRTLNPNRWNLFQSGITGGTVTNVSGTGALSFTNSTTTPVGTIDTSWSGGLTTRLTTRRLIDSLGFIKLNISDTIGMLSPYLRKTDTSYMLTPYLRNSDTLTMLSKYLLKTDTSYMLSPFVKYSDTAYLVANRLKISDTAYMLSAYALDYNTVHKTGTEFIYGTKHFLDAPFVQSIAVSNGTYESVINSLSVTAPRSLSLPDASGTIALTSNLTPYLLKVDSLSGGYTSWLLTKKKIDSLGALKLNISDTTTMLSGYLRTGNATTGTVTSVATNNGTGINGGTITTTGTLAIDTLNISTRLWRQKGIDSVMGQVSLKLNISDTATMLSPFVQYSDTAYMLSNRLKISDTTTMLSGYQRTGNSTIGTVTSIATTAPITGGTITSSGTIGITQATTSTNGYLSSTDWNTFNGKENVLTFSTGLSRVGNTVTNTITQYTDALARSSLSFTAGSGAYNSTTGVITIPTNNNQITNGAGYITGNQTITLSGDISGSGTTAITTAIGAGKVTNTMLAGSIDYAKMNAATVPTWNQNTTGTAASLSAVLSSSLGGAGSVSGILKANGSGVVSAAVAGTDYVAPSALSGYLPLSGGTLSGALSGTSLSMSGGANLATSSGSVGIGTTGIYAKLTVGNSDATSEISSGGNDTHLTLRSVGASGAIRFYTIGGSLNTMATTESGRFAAGTGNLLIKTTTDNGTDALQVAGSGLFSASGDNYASVSTTGTSNASRLDLISGNGTTSGKYAYIKHINSQTAAQEWRVGTYGNDSWSVNDATYATTHFSIAKQTGAATFSSSVTATSFVKSGATSAHILAGDGSTITAGTNITISGGTISSTNPGGTVTSVATNNGTGINGGTITSTGTLAIDTTNIATRLWHKKGIDSAIGLIPSLILLSGSYTPTYSTGTNISTYTINSCLYTQVGTSITVTGELSVTPSASTTATTFEMSLPLATGTSTANQFNGTGTTSESSVAPFRSVLIGKGTGSNMQFSFTSGAALEANIIKFTFTYQYVAP